MEWFEVLKLLAQAHEFDRLLGHRFQAQGRAAARVAVELGQNAAGDLKRLIEVRGHVDRFLPGGRIEHQQDFVRTQSCWCSMRPPGRKRSTWPRTSIRRFRSPAAF